MRFVDHRRRRALLERCADEVVTVARLALDGDEQIAALAACACRSKRRRRRAGNAAAHARSQRRRRAPIRSTSACRSSCLRKRLQRRARPPRDRRTAARGRRRSGRFRGPCRRRRARRPAASTATAWAMASRAVADLAMRAAARPCQDLRADRGGILAARIVVRHDHDIGALRGDLAHHRPLAAIAVAAAAEDDDQPPGRQRAQRREHFLQRVGLVRVVDEDRRAVALADESRAAPARPATFRAPQRPTPRPRRTQCKARPRRARWRPGRIAGQRQHDLAASAPSCATSRRVASRARLGFQETQRFRHCARR